MRRFISNRFLAKTLFGSEKPFRGIPVQLSKSGVILYKITRSLNRTRVAVLGLINHRSSVVCTIPFLILPKSNFTLGFFLPPSCFLALRLLEVCPVSRFTTTSAMASDSRMNWSERSCFYYMQSKNQSGESQTIALLGSACDRRIRSCP